MYSNKIKELPMLSYLAEIIRRVNYHLFK